MNREDLVLNEKGYFVDPYNGVEHVEIKGSFIPLVAGGLPAKLKTIDGKMCMVNALGTFLVGDDGRVSKDSLEGSKAAPKDIEEMNNIQGLVHEANIRTGNMTQVAEELGKGMSTGIDEKVVDEPTEEIEM